MAVVPPKAHVVGTPVKVFVDKKTVRGVITRHTPCFVIIKLEDGTEIRRKKVEEITDEESTPLKSTCGKFPSSHPIPVETTSSNSSSAPKHPYTRSQANPNMSTFPFKQGVHRIGGIKMLTPDQRDPLNRTLMGHLFGDRVCKLEYSDHGSRLRNFTVQKTYWDRGYCFELLAQKLHSDRAKFGRLQRPELFYVITEGPGLEPIDLRKELKSLFDIESLAPYKAASRMELLLTPSKMTTKTRKESEKPMIFDLSSDEFEIVKENCHEGCGFISRRAALELLGEGEGGQRATTIQCRAIVPGIGLIKGLFKVKEGIQRIQIPSSMIKCGPSKSTNPEANAILLVKRSFPSEHNRYVQQFFAKEQVYNTGLNELQSPLKDMIKDVLFDCGVPMRLLAQYDKKRTGSRKEREAIQKDNGRSQRSKHKQSKKKDLPGDDLHVGDTYCVGVADPTSGGVIPNGHVFIPGLPGHVESVLVTRAPCMDKQDLLRLPLLKTKPPAMSLSEWNTLNAQHFGDICFGKGSVPLPSLIADGDLDGDLYFVMWEETIVDCIDMANVPKLERNARLAKRRATNVGSSPLQSSDGDWFDLIQNAVADVGFAIKVGELIGSLYHEAKYECNSDEKVYEDYVALGKAFKQSLDLKKHGDKVILPKTLWDAVNEDLHEFLVNG